MKYRSGRTKSKTLVAFLLSATTLGTALVALALLLRRSDERLIPTWVHLLAALMTLLSVVEQTISRSRSIKRRRITNIKKKYPKLSIVAIMRERKARQMQSALIVLLVSLIAYIGLSEFIDYAVDVGVLLILASLVVLLLIDKVVLDYRVQRGFYGNNEREAREIIAFIRQESLSIDFTDDGKPKKIISEEDLRQIEQIAAQSVPATVTSS